jgi:hypothetical protein
MLLSLIGRQDKQAQEAFKAEIRNRLMSTGRIRGVPRQRRTPPAGLAAFGMVVPDYDPLMGGPGPPSADAFRPRYAPLGIPAMHPGFAEPGLYSPYGKSSPVTSRRPAHRR